MNSFIKFWPLAYTYNTRMNRLANLIYYIGTDLFLPIIIILYIVLFNNQNIATFINYIVMYILIYIVFMLFYEIWYIYNDNFSTKKEKNPTYNVKEKFSNRFRYFQIVLRVFIWSLILLFLYLSLKIWVKYIIIDIIIMEVIFLIHNIIRNYTINMFTRLLLRLTKLSLFIIFLNIIWLSWESCNDIVFSYLIFHFLDLFASRFYSYNWKLSWKNELKYWYSYFFECIIFIFISIVLNNYIYLFPLILLIFKIWYFLKSNKNTFSIKNDR